MEKEPERYFTCSVCGKSVYIPIMAGADYGWRLGEKRFCSYHCMRAYEKKKLTERKRVEKRSPVSPMAYLERFTKLDLYLSLLEDGATVTEAWKRAGYATSKQASDAKSRFNNRADFEEWRKQYGTRAGKV